MKVLIIGSGGREHALAWKMAQSPQVDEVLVAPGNAGTALEPGVRNLPLDITDLAAAVALARREAVDLTLVGPEAPLVAGIVDAFQAEGLACFGPSRAAAQLEGSKTFSKDFLQRHAIPTAAYASFDQLEPALDYLRRQSLPIVVKADGLAAGKGVVVAEELAVAEAAVRAMLADNRFGSAGARVVIEDFLRGEEASFIAICDGRHALPMATSQDHKARDDGDRGPNTGGMGAYSPAPVVTPELHQRVMDEVIYPTLRGMAAEGHPYVGFLYAGLMIAADGTPRVLEFNCRFGDPETQPIMLRLQSDLLELCQAALTGSLNQLEPRWDPRPALGVVMAAGGYPETYAKGLPVQGLPAPQADAHVFHAGTRLAEGQVLTDGGRVLCVTALGDSVAAAQRLAYAQVAGIHWPDVYYRRDIGHRAVAREAAPDGPLG